MNGPQHYAEAERLLALAMLDDIGQVEAGFEGELAAAQVHANACVVECGAVVIRRLAAVRWTRRAQLLATVLGTWAAAALVSAFLLMLTARGPR